jgi:hypothetical protein
MVVQIVIPATMQEAQIGELESEVGPKLKFKTLSKRIAK